MIGSSNYIEATLTKGDIMTINRFAKGSGCYVCAACGYRTRRTGDGANVGVCELCYEIGGCENTMSDNDPTSEAYKNAEHELARYKEMLATRNATK